MDSAKIIYKNKGIAVLEAVGALSFILILIIAAFGLVEYMRLSRALQTALDKIAYETALKPFVITNQVDSLNSTRIALNSAALESYINNSLDSLEEDFLPFFRKISANQTPEFLAQAAYAEIHINSQSGEFEEMVNNPFSYQKTQGSEYLLNKLNQRVRLEDQFAVFAGRRGEASAVYALPHAGFSLQQNNDRYLPSTVLVGIRVGLSLSDTLLGRMLSMAGMEAFIADYKIVTLRGEIADG